MGGAANTTVIWHFMRPLLIFIVTIFSFQNLKASPQSPDFFIVGQDTIPIYFLPLHHLDETTQKNFFSNLRTGDSLFFGSLNLWRGYQAYWQLTGNMLYLVGLKGYKNSDDILKRSFPDRYKDGKVFADWFSSYLAIPKGKILKWDGVFSRTYYREEVFDFKNGALTDTKTVDNYTDLKKGISRLDKKFMKNAIFKRIKKLNWKKLSACDCDDTYEITIDESGKISDIELLSYSDDTQKAKEYAEELRPCIEKFKAQLEDMQFDIIRWNGKPYSEKVRIELFYDKKLENWTE